MATILIGMGNPVLSDDGVGLEIARRVARLMPADPELAIRELYSGGLNLMEAMAGYDRALIVDAICTLDGRPGTIHLATVNSLFHTHNTCSTHDANLAVALELGRLAGLQLPSEIRIWGVETADVTTFGEQLTEAVAQAVPAVVEQVMCELRRDSRSGEPA
jgi:hydrogenase maturation protease